MTTINKYNSQWKILLALLIFVAINFIMHVFSIESASYTEGADAGRYYMSGLDIASGKGLGDLRYNGPLYPIYIAIHIYLVGETFALTALVISQSVLLFITGYIISLLSRNLGLSVIPLIALLFVIANPNSLMIAHLVQTETLFTLLLTIYFFLLHKYFQFQNMKILLSISLIAVLISLTRPAGMYVMAFFPLIIIPILFNKKNIGKWLIHNVIYLFILVIGTGSIGIYNQKVHGEYFISANKGHVFYDQYIALLNYGYDLSTPNAHEKAREILINNVGPDFEECADNFTSIKCKDEVASIFINEIIHSKPLAIIKGFSTSVTSLLFSGGASNFANYYGIEAKKHTIEHESAEGGRFEIRKIYKFILSINLPYLAALFIFWGWAFFTKILMTVGFIHEIKKENKLFFFGVSIVLLLFILEYIFLGQSRWRAPIDPIFMMFSAVGFSFLLGKIKPLLILKKKLIT